MKYRLYVHPYVHWPDIAETDLVVVVIIVVLVVVVVDQLWS